MHDQLTKYKCNVSPCDRSYSSSSTFRLHHRKHFINYPAIDSIRIPNQEEENQLNCQVNAATERENDQEIDHNDIPVPSTSTSTHINIDLLTNQLKKLNLGFTLKWLSKSDLPRKVPFELRSDIEKYYIDPFRKAFESVSAVEPMGNLTKQILDEFNSSVSDESEYMFIQRLKKEDLLSDPSLFTTENELLLGNEQQFVEDRVQGVLMPIKFQLRKFLESPGMYECIINNLVPSNDGTFRSVVDGEVWKKRKELFTDHPGVVIPLNVYLDDFTTSDTASTHASGSSICGVYMSIPCLPFYLLTKLSNILIVGYIRTIDKKNNDNNRTFYRLIETLEDLANNGINIVIQNQEKKVYFALCFVLGDNLGMNGITGFVESFRANHFCRVCKRSREQTETDAEEFPRSLRTARNYQLDLALNDKSATGIKQECIFNRLNYFHVCDNFVFDVMHDMLEGVLVYNLQHCLYYFLFVQRYFTVHDLNHRKNTFVFGNLHSGNLPDDFVESKLKNKQIKMTASEMKTFWVFLPLIIGSAIPEDDPVWNFVKTTLKLLHVTLLVDVPIFFIEELKKLVQEHNTQYVQLFDDTLKPKFHFLVHYATAIQKCGSLRRNWAMRFEAKHHEPKSYIRVSNNRQNICYSMSVKAGYNFAHNIVNNNFFFDRISVSNDLTVKKLPEAYSFSFDVISNFIDIDSACFAKNVCKEGSEFAKGCNFILQLHNIINIYKCRDLVVSSQDVVYFFVQRYASVSFNDHVQSFELVLSDRLMVLQDQPHIYSKSVNLHSYNDKTYLRIPNYYDCNTDIDEAIIVTNDQ